jgi:hypothetical protein
MARKTVRFCEALHAQIRKYRFFMAIEAEFHIVRLFSPALRATPTK